MTPANGQVPASELVRVGGVRLESATGQAFQRAVDDAQSQGYLVRPALPLGGYRDLSEQAALKANPKAYGSSLASKDIAAPGTSTHGFGTCVDVLVGLDWFAPRAGSYGFVRESPSGETNHFRFLHPSFADTSTVTLGGFLMTLTDNQQTEMYNALVRNGYFMTDAISNQVAAVAAGGIKFPGADYAAFTALANQLAAVLTAVQGLAGGQPVDVAALIKQSAQDTQAAFTAQITALQSALEAELTVPGVTQEQIAAGVSAALAKLTLITKTN